MSNQNPELFAQDGSPYSFAIVAARYNQDLVDMLLGRVLGTLIGAGVAKENIETMRVPGAHELPYAVGILAETGQVDCVIALGVVLAGETSHHDVIATTTSAAFHEIGGDTTVPVINGLLVTENREQAQARCGETIDRGAEFARAAIEMASLKVSLGERMDAAAGNHPLMEALESLTDDPHWNPFLANDDDEDDDDTPWKS